MTEVILKQQSPVFKGGELLENRSLVDALDIRKTNLNDHTPEDVFGRHRQFVTSVCDSIGDMSYLGVSVTETYKNHPQSFLTTGRHEYEYVSTIRIWTFDPKNRRRLSPYGPSSVSVALKVVTSSDGKTITTSTEVVAPMTPSLRGNVMNTHVLKRREHGTLPDERTYEPRVARLITKVLNYIGSKATTLEGISNPRDLINNFPRVTSFYAVIDPQIGREKFTPVYSSAVSSTEVAKDNLSFLRMSDQKLYTIDQIDTRFGLILDKPFVLSDLIGVQS